MIKINISLETEFIPRLSLLPPPGPTSYLRPWYFEKSTENEVTSQDLEILQFCFASGVVHGNEVAPHPGKIRDPKNELLKKSNNNNLNFYSCTNPREQFRQMAQDLLKEIRLVT